MRTFIFLMLSVFLLVSCGENRVVTIPWEPDAQGFRQFSSNNQLVAESLAYLPLSDLSQEPFSAYELQVKKMSGDYSAGYGMLVNYLDESNYTLVLISLDGAYCVESLVNGTYRSHCAWTQEPSILSAYGDTNIIRLTQNAAGNYDLHINGSFINRYTDLPRTGGLQGYALIISGSENFPQVPVDVRFKAEGDKLLSASYAGRLIWP